MKPLQTKKFSVFTILDFLIILAISAVPLFLSYSYRINIFLSWEGAYRMYLGQMPYRDFGLPLGYGYWLIPALFFKLFGPYMFTLVKAQVFINVLSGLSFRKIMKNMGMEGITLTTAVWVFCISYSFLNFWPWYNHTVMVYQFIGLAFLTSSFTASKNLWSNIYAVLAGLFLFLSFFTKQDAGALGILIALAISVVYSIINKNFRQLGVLILSMLFWALLIIIPLNHSFAYWFNHGQPPHNSRMSVGEILAEFFKSSQWIKFYLLGMIVVAFHRLSQRSLLRSEEAVFFFLVLGILAEAAIFQVTSYVPADNNIFFHSFALAFFMWYLYSQNALRFQNPLLFLSFSFLLLIFFSDRYWTYISRFVESSAPQGRVERKSPSGENVVDKTNYVIDTERETSVLFIPTSEWKFIDGMPSFAKVKMPQSTIDGINRIKVMPQFTGAKRPKVLNMSELTPLAYELNFELERGPDYPLWFHLGVGMFNKQLKMFDKRIQDNYYDVVLFEQINFLNNFYPFEVRRELQKHYKKVDTFLAPRNPIGGDIEVYIRK